MARLALLLSHDGRNGRPAVIGRLAASLRPLFDEVRWVLVSSSTGGGPTSPASVETDAVDPIHLRMPQVPPARAALVDWLTSPAVDLCAGWRHATLDRALHEAALVVVESGPLAAALRRFRREARQAELVYFATGRLLPTGVHRRVGQLLRRDARLVDRAVTTVRALVPDLTLFGARARFVPADPDEALREPAGEDAGEGSTAVVLDAGHLDASVVGIAATTLPATRFHLLGGASGGHRFPSNVVLHGELPPGRAERLLQRADLALVPDTSDPPDTVDVCAAVDRLRRLGLPIVCPAGLADHDPRLFGYDIGRSASIRSALRLAVRTRREPTASPRGSWRDVARCVAGEDRVPHAGFPTPDERRHAG